MPIYTCTAVESTLSTSVKANLAGEIARIHSAINHVPSTYVNTVFLGLPMNSQTSMLHVPARAGPNG